MPLKDYINKEGYIETVAGIGATLAGQATDTATERELPWLTQTQIALEVTVAFHASADGGLRVRILEYMTSGSAATVATPGNEGTIPLDVGTTVRQTFLFTVRSRYYLIELFNMDSSAGRDAGSIAVQIIENPEGVQGQDGQVQTHTQYWDGEAWQPQLIMAWETGGNLDRITASVEIMDDWDESDRAKVNIIVGQTGITANAGAVAANTPRMTLASDDPAVVALQIIDDWDESDRAMVNLIVGQAGIAAGAGAVGVTVPRVTLASDDPAVTALEIIDDWDESDRAMVNPIVGQAGIAAGAGAVGVTVPRVTLASDDPAVTALEIIDDWDESDRAMVNPIVGQAGIAAGAGAVGVTVPRVTLASDDPAVTALEIIDDWDESDRAKVNLIVGQAGVSANTGVMDATTQRVTLATDDPAVIALQLLDDAIKTDDAAFTPATDKVSMIGAILDDAAPDSVDEGDAGALRMSANRNLYTRLRDAAGNERGANVTAANELTVIESNSGAIQTALEIIDDWDETDRAKVNLIVGQAGIAAGAGVVGVTVPRMTLASDDPAVTALEIIDDWDETDRAAVNLIAGQVAITANAGVVAANTPRVTLGSDDPAVTALEIIDDWDETDRAKVNLIVGQAGIAAGAGAVGVTVPRVTLANDDPAVVALQLLDDAIKTDDTAFTPATDKVSMIGAILDDAAPDSVDEGDAGALRMSANRNLYIQLRDAAGNERGVNITAANELNVLESNSTAIQTALEIIDDWDETDRAKVNLIVGQAGIAAGAGVVGVTVPRVTLASDDPAVVALQIIDDWDETDRAKVNPIVGQAGVTANTGVIDAATQRVTIATNDTVATDLTAIRTALQIIDDWDETDRAAVNLIAGQAAITAGAGVVAANTPRMTLASDDPAVTALQIIDDWDETDRAKVNLIAGQVAITAGAGAVAANTPRTTLASDDPAVVALQKIDGMSTLTDAVETALTQIIQTVAAVGTPEAIAGAGTFFRRATVIAKKAARTANAGIVYLGVTAGNDTQPIEMNPGDIFTIEAPPGEKYDFDNWYADVLNAGDGVIVIYS